MDAFCGVAVCLAVLGGTPDGVVLDFSAQWCPPCRSMEPVVHRLQRQGYPIRQIDADEQPAVLEHYGVTGLPTFVLIVRGQEVERVSGAVSEATLRRMLGRIPEKTDPLPVPVTNAVPVAQKKSVPPRSENSPSGLMANLKSLIRLPLPAPTAPSSVTLDEFPPAVIRANSDDLPAPGIATDPMLGCTRIRVRDSHGLDVGSGTIIHSEPGRTLILTCGHLFRHFDSQGQIKVDIFGPKPQTLDGTLIRHNLDEDIGLISVSPLETLPVVPIAAQPVTARDHVFSVGCGGGDDPTKLQHLVTSTTKYRDFVECTGTPIQGRSGGGLFTKSGKLAGVCVFADPAARRGLYAGLGTISRLLTQCGLSWLQPAALASSSDHLAGNQSTPHFESDVAGKSDVADRFDRLAADNEFDAETPPFLSDTELLDPESLPSSETPPRGLPSTVGEFSLDNLLPTVDDSAFADVLPGSSNAELIRTSGGQLDAMDRVPELGRNTLTKTDIQLAEAAAENRPEPGRRPVVGPSVESLQETLEAAHGAEVVCIVRDRDHPDAPSRIVVINQASRQFVSDLTGELAQQIQPTSKVVPAVPDDSTQKIERYQRRTRSHRVKQR
ncbi:thioredoxin fold domain-containing protein [bacterium]|nr:thioredoxin fold domain-containing protein [bacterium]